MASRPAPNSGEVRIEWSVVGCTIGYRVAITGPGVEQSIEVPGGGSSTITVPNLSPSRTFRITVTSVGATGDGGVSGVFRLNSSATTTQAGLTLEFPDSVPDGLIPAADGGRGPWVNPVLSWKVPETNEATSYRIAVMRGDGTAIVEKTVPGTATSARLGDEVAAGIPYTVTLTPVLVDGTDGKPSRLTVGKQQAPSPAQVTGNAPVIQFSQVADPPEARVLGYELAYGAGQASTHVFIAAPSGSAASAPWIAVDPTFEALDGSDTATPPKSVVAMVRTITTEGRSSWTASQRIPYTPIGTGDAAYFAGIGRLGPLETVPRYGFLKVRGDRADLEITDLVWSQSRRGLGTPVTVTVHGPDGSAVFTQHVPITHTAPAGQDAWRVSDLPLPDGWSSIVLRRGGADVVQWSNTGGQPCVGSVTYTDAPTDLPEMWRDSWCSR